MLEALKALVVANYNQQSAMQREVMAKSQGLAPEKYSQVYPGSTVTNTTTNNNTAGGLLKGALLSAAMLATGGAGVAGLAVALRPSEKEKIEVATPTPSTPAPISPATPKVRHYDAITEELQPDGTWKQIKRERLK